MPFAAGFVADFGVDLDFVGMERPPRLRDQAVAERPCVVY
jgi:hypothetical protein